MFGSVLDWLQDIYIKEVEPSAHPGIKKLIKDFRKYNRWKTYMYEKDSSATYNRVSNERSVDYLLRKFLNARKEYQVLGSGSYGTAFKIKGYHDVFKTCTNDLAYLMYADACMKYQYAWMPMIYEKAVYDVHNKVHLYGKLHIFRLEELEPSMLYDFELPRYDTLHHMSECIRTICSNPEYWRNAPELEFFQTMNKHRTFKRHTAYITQCRKVFLELNQKASFDWDVRDPNVMVRLDNAVHTGKGDIIFSDPIHNATPVVI